MERQKPLLIILTFILALNLGCAKKEEEEPSDFKTGSEPKGFRYNWGTNVLGALDELNYIGIQIHPLNIMYSKRDEDLQLEGIELEKIEYSFWKAKFYAATIYARSEKNFKLLRRYLFSEFGEPKIVEQNEDWSKYAWVGKETKVELRYINFGQLGRLRIEAKEVANEVEKEIQKYLETKHGEGGG